jgi:hypothetical protein
LCCLVRVRNLNVKDIILSSTGFFVLSAAVCYTLGVRILANCQLAGLLFAFRLPPAGHGSWHWAISGG